MPSHTWFSCTIGDSNHDGYSSSRVAGGRTVHCNGFSGSRANIRRNIGCCDCWCRLVFKLSSKFNIVIQHCLVINNVYHEIVQRSAVVSTFIANNGSTAISLNPSNVVSSISSLPSDSPVRYVLVEAYVSAWQKGCYALVGMAGLQLILCAMMRRVEFNDPSSKIKTNGIEPENQIQVEGKVD